MKRWIIIVIVAAGVVMLCHFIATRQRTGNLRNLRKCSDVTTLVPSGPIERNDQTISGQVYVVPDQEKCKEEK